LGEEYPIGLSCVNFNRLGGQGSTSKVHLQPVGVETSNDLENAFSAMINLKTAKQIGITIPPNVLRGRTG
jgi:hypothetical protein